MNQALSRMPITSTTVISMTIRKAGRLKTMGKPKMRGASARAWAARWTTTPMDSRSVPAGLRLGDLAGGLGGGPVVGAEPARAGDADAAQQLLEVAGPGDGDRDVADRVLDDQVPADDPADQLAQGGVGVGVGRAGDRHHRGELGVAEGREAAGDGGDDEGEDERRPGPGVVGAAGGGGADRREDAGADDGADAEQGELDRRRASAAAADSGASAEARIAFSDLVRKMPSEQGSSPRAPVRRCRNAAEHDMGGGEGRNGAGTLPVDPWAGTATSEDGGPSHGLKLGLRRMGAGEGPSGPPPLGETPRFVFRACFPLGFARRMARKTAPPHRS